MKSGDGGELCGAVTLRVVAVPSGFCNFAQNDKVAAPKSMWQVFKLLSPIANVKTL